MNPTEASPSQAAWNHFPHGADIGIQGLGASLAAAFEQAAVALTALVAGPAGLRPDSEVRLTCQARDPETLLAEWLNALIYEMAVRHMLFSRFQVRILDGHLEAEARGETVEPVRHQPAVEPKGATYTELKVMQEEGCWIAQCVVDV